MGKSNTDMPRHNHNFVGYRNVTLVGGVFDGMLVEYFRDHTTGVHTQTGIVYGTHRTDTYCINKADVTKALACDNKGKVR